MLVWRKAAVVIVGRAQVVLVDDADSAGGATDAASAPGEDRARRRVYRTRRRPQ